MLFERLWRAGRVSSLPSQPLLLPEPLELPVQQALILHRHLTELERLGLLIEPFGPSSFLIRSLPVMFGHTDLAALVQDLIDDLEQWDSISSLEMKVKPILASLACHGAVRAGRAMALPEIKQLVQDWVAEGLIMTCPHGRRVAFRLSADELARMFDRALGRGSEIAWSGCQNRSWLRGRWWCWSVRRRSGKARLDFGWPRALDTEILTADSRQVYRGMDVATDKPTLEQRRAGASPAHRSGRS